jgi:hypothetical protein
MQIEEIQRAVRTWAAKNPTGSGMPIAWNKIIGKGCFIESSDRVHCPSGGAYEFSTLTPEIGQLAAKCPDPEHQNFAHDDW